MNLSQHQHLRMHKELDSLAKLQILNTGQVEVIKDRYPVTAWNFMALVRAFTVLGALTAIAGVVVLVREYMNWWLLSEATLALSGVGLLVLGHWLRVRKTLLTTGEVAEFIGCIALQGLMTVLAIHYSADSGNWPGLLGAETLVLACLAYVTANRLVLWYTCATFFFWFGAETGYISGWGCYWLGMTYPMRFLAAGICSLLLAWLHVRVVRGRWAAFSRIYAHFGLLIINLALWFLSVFGYYEDYDIRWSDTSGERFLFSLLWAALALGSIYGGARFGVRLLRSYGLTFLILNLYTFYFQFVVANTGEAWFLHMLLTGGSLLYIGHYFERKRRREGTRY